MFIVHGHPFEIDPKVTRLSGWLKRDEGTGNWEISWSIAVHTISQTFSDTASTDDDPVTLSPAIHLNALFEAADWCGLVGTRHAFGCDSNSTWLLHEQWEPVKHLDLSFGTISDRSIALVIEGIGLQESWPELFGFQVPFRAAIAVPFSGVGLIVPADVSDPAAHALQAVRYFFPDYRFDPPSTREIRAADRLRGTEFLFPPEAGA